MFVFFRNTTWINHTEPKFDHPDLCSTEDVSLKIWFFMQVNILKSKNPSSVDLKIWFFSMLNKDTLTNKTCFGYRKKN